MNIAQLPQLYQQYGFKPVRGAFCTKDYADPITIDFLNQHPFVDKVGVEDEEIEKWAEVSYGKEYIYGFAMGWDSGGPEVDLDKEPESYRIGYKDAQQAIRTLGDRVVPAKLLMYT